MNTLQVKQRFGVIGNSPALDNALNTAIRVAPTDLTVLITGPSGVGKEVFSKIIHALSPRKHNNFIAVNCGAIPDGTINSELFGHVKGSFTGADSERKGYFETCDGGTIFLDEIGEMPLDTQAYLLRILESGEYIPVGSSKVKKTNVRVIAATNVDLFGKIDKGKFREDLYYRLNIVPIKVPALRERREDIHLLFRKFASDFSDKYKSDAIQLDAGAIQMLEAYSWPGNIRELKNFAEQLCIMSPSRHIHADILSQFLPEGSRRQYPVQVGNGAEKESFAEREILYKLLFDMKKDLNDLKSLVFELVHTNDLQMPDISHIKAIAAPIAPEYKSQYPTSDVIYPQSTIFVGDSPSAQPMVIKPAGASNSKDYSHHEQIEEDLSFEDMERMLIKKALKKHKSRRKDAASELGISERTLYRKIKQYGIE
jgi:DNA-binding NtrC family response regulator